MEEKQPRAHLKRPLPEDGDGDSRKPTPKRVRFPKGKKVKPGNEKVDAWKPPEEETAEQIAARKAAKERSMRRNQIAADLFTEENRGMLPDITAAEEQYKANETFVDDGIKIEPFNLDQEREEGYFDEQGNYVEYVNENEIKDAWLDSAEIDQNLADKTYIQKDDEDDENKELTSEEVGKMKRRIADTLEPGETVLRALKRLKGNSNNRKEKMSASTKEIFDQLTEDAMKLMENGDYNVYDEKKEVFQREAEGYEKLARARGGESTSFDPSQGKSDSVIGSQNDEELDMFADDDENDTGKLTTEDGNSTIIQPTESGDPMNDYVYDQSSGYYYSSSLGYYYDPSSTLYCSAASGVWYSYNEDTGTYDEVQPVQEPVSNVS